MMGGDVLVVGHCHGLSLQCTSAFVVKWRSHCGLHRTSFRCHTAVESCAANDWPLTNRWPVYTSVVCYVIRDPARLVLSLCQRTVHVERNRILFCNMNLSVDVMKLDIINILNSFSFTKLF